MSGIIEPWPENDYRNPQPYDQRGCCWPWGVDGPREKLPMRWGVYVDRYDAGPIDVEWTFMQLGWLMVIYGESDAQLNSGTWRTSRVANPATAINITHHFEDNAWDITCTLGLDGLPLRLVQGSYRMLPGDNSANDFFFPILSAVGPAPRPDRIWMLPFVWWADTAPYDEHA